MQYPSRSDYCTTIRNPTIAFRKKDPTTKREQDLDSSLVTGNPVERTKKSGTKELWFSSGSFACVFKFKTTTPNKLWAVRCFLRSTSNIVSHYTNVLARLKNSECSDYFVDFTFLESGIRVQGNCYPILKMEWVEGQDIKTFIRDNLDDKNKLNVLSKLWIELSRNLLQAGIAHGDLQHGNVFLVNLHKQLPSIKLLDYDSLYFSPTENHIADQIKGIPDYQHPLRATLKNQCIHLDFFAELVIYISIRALAENKQLWKNYNLDNTEGLLFSSTDFHHPDSAKIFKDLSTLSPPVPALADELKKICKLEKFTSIPDLDDVLSSAGDVQSRVSNQVWWKPRSRTGVSNPNPTPVQREHPNDAKVYSKVGEVGGAGSPTPPTTPTQYIPAKVGYTRSPFPINPNYLIWIFGIALFAGLLPIVGSPLAILVKQQVFTWQIETDLQQHLVNNPENKNLEIKKTLQALEPKVQIDSKRIAISYNGLANKNLTQERGIKRLAILFFEGLMNEHPNLLPHDGTQLVVYPRSGSLQVTITLNQAWLDKWNSFNKNELTYEQLEESLKASSL